MDRMNGEEQRGEQSDFRRRMADRRGEDEEHGAADDGVEKHVRHVVAEG